MIIIPILQIRKLKYYSPIKSWSVCVCVCVCVCTHGLCCVWSFATPWTVAHQAPLSMAIFQARILEWIAISFSRRSS